MLPESRVEHGVREELEGEGETKMLLEDSKPVFPQFNIYFPSLRNFSQNQEPL